MKLLKYENYQVVPTEECFMIKPLRELFNEDTSTDKELFMLNKNARVMYDNVCGAIDMYYDSLEYNC